MSSDAILYAIARADRAAGIIEGLTTSDRDPASRELSEAARALLHALDDIRHDAEDIVQERDEALYLAQREHDAAIPERTQRALSDIRDRLDRVEGAYRAHLQGDAHGGPGA
jgi:hypothetical protein